MDRRNAHVDSFGGSPMVIRRGILWNTIGSAVYALTSMLLGALVTRVLGADAGGLFFFAFSTFGQQMYIVAYFGMRPVQVTDTRRRHSFGEYLRFRYLTCALSMVSAAGYAFFCFPGGEARAVLLLMVFYKVLDGLADCFDSEFQRMRRLDLTGKSNAFRTLLAVAAFTGVMLSARSLLPACEAAVLGQGLGVLLFCVLPLMQQRSVPAAGAAGSRNGGAESSGRAWTGSVRPGSQTALFRESVWLFLASFLDLYIFAASKYSVNRYLTNADNSYYTTIFIPTSVINLMANFVIRPVLTALSADHDQGRGERFGGSVGKIAALIAVLTALGMGAAWLFGIPALSILVGPAAGEALKPCRGALVTVILGGGCYAALNLLYYVLVIFRRQRSIFLIYCCTAVFSRLLSDRMVRLGGLDGAARAYLISMAVLTALFAGVVFFSWAGEFPAETGNGGMADPAEKSI